MGWASSIIQKFQKSVLNPQFLDSPQFLLEKKPTKKKSFDSFIIKSMDPTHNSHIKLLAFDFLSLTQKSSSSSSSDHVLFFRNGRPVYRAETLGVVVSRDEKSNKFLKFLIDDGTGCVPCILWLNQFDFYSRRKNPSDVRLIADMAKDQASQIQLGVLARVRGRITPYKGTVQITVSDVVIERDPNSEILHWLDCVKLAKKCYECKPPPVSSNLQKHKQ